MLCSVCASLCPFKHCLSPCLHLTEFLWESFSCTMEPPDAAEFVAKYFLLFTCSTSVLLELSKKKGSRNKTCDNNFHSTITDDMSQLVSKLTFCCIEASMCDHKDTVLKLVGTAVSTCSQSQSTGI